MLTKANFKGNEAPFLTKTIGNHLENMVFNTRNCKNATERGCRYI